MTVTVKTDPCPRGRGFVLPQNPPRQSLRRANLFRRRGIYFPSRRQIERNGKIFFDSYGICGGDKAAVFPLQNLDVPRSRSGSGRRLSDCVQRPATPLFLYGGRAHGALPQSGGMRGARRHEKTERAHHRFSAHRTRLVRRHMRAFPCALGPPRRTVCGRTLCAHIPHYASRARHVVAVCAPAELVLGTQELSDFLLPRTRGRSAENRLRDAVRGRIFRRAYPFPRCAYSLPFPPLFRRSSSPNNWLRAGCPSRSPRRSTAGWRVWRCLS